MIKKTEPYMIDVDKLNLDDIGHNICMFMAPASIKTPDQVRIFPFTIENIPATIPEFETVEREDYQYLTSIYHHWKYEGTDLSASVQAPLRKLISLIAYGEVGYFKLHRDNAWDEEVCRVALTWKRIGTIDKEYYYYERSIQEALNMQRFGYDMGIYDTYGILSYEKSKEELDRHIARLKGELEK